MEDTIITEIRILQRHDHCEFPCALASEPNAAGVCNIGLASSLAREGLLAPPLVRRIPPTRARELRVTMAKVRTNVGSHTARRPGSN